MKPLIPGGFDGIFIFILHLNGTVCGMLKMAPRVILLLPYRLNFQWVKLRNCAHLLSFERLNC